MEAITTMSCSTNIISVCKTDEEILRAFPVMVQLRPHLQQENFVETIRKQENESYRLISLVVDDRAVAVSGVRILNNLAFGQILYVDDLVVDDKERSKGYGKQMFDWLLEYAKNNHCHRLHLDSGVQRYDAHRFYMGQQKMIIGAHHFCREV